LAFAALGAALVAVPAASGQPDAPFVPTPPVVVDAMLELAAVGPGDYVVDLGSGDGRIPIAAAKRFGARGLGVELDGALVAEARREARRAGVADRVEFREENLLFADIRAATVVTLYLSSSLMHQLRPRLLRELRPGTRIVSHDFGLGEWRPDRQITVPVPDKPYGPPRSEVFLWIVPADAAGLWRWRSSVGGVAVDYRLELEQSFQALAGAVQVGDRPGRFEGGQVQGERIRFTLTAEVGRRPVRHEFEGRLSGDAIEGRVRLAGFGELDWSAARVRRSGAAREGTPDFGSGKEAR
jgi:SAM-dependent methyltransferase